MKFSFRPTEGAFYELFTRAAQNLVRGTALLNELALPGVDVQSVSERLTEVEHDSDQITHELYKKINSTFITPFDREDIYRLGSLLDDVMDHLEAVGNLLYLYGLTELPALPRELHEMVQRARPAGQADRRRDAPAEVDEGPRGLLDRVQPAGERGRPDQPACCSSASSPASTTR